MGGGLSGNPKKGGTSPVEDVQYGIKLPNDRLISGLLKIQVQHSNRTGPLNCQIRKLSLLCASIPLDYDGGFFSIYDTSDGYGFWFDAGIGTTVPTFPSWVTFIEKILITGLTHNKLIAQAVVDAINASKFDGTTIIDANNDVYIINYGEGEIDPLIDEEDVPDANNIDILGNRLSTMTVVKESSEDDGSSIMALEEDVMQAISVYEPPATSEASPLHSGIEVMPDASNLGAIGINRNSHTAGLGDSSVYLFNIMAGCRISRTERNWGTRIVNTTEFTTIGPELLMNTVGESIGDWDVVTDATQSDYATVASVVSRIWNIAFYNGANPGAFDVNPVGTMEMTAAGIGYSCASFMEITGLDINKIYQVSVKKAKYMSLYVMDSSWIPSNVPISNPGAYVPHDGTNAIFNHHSSTATDFTRRFSGEATVRIVMQTSNAGGTYDVDGENKGISLQEVIAPANFHDDLNTGLGTETSSSTLGPLTYWTQEPDDGRTYMWVKSHLLSHMNNAERFLSDYSIRSHRLFLMKNSGGTRYTLQCGIDPRHTLIDGTPALWPDTRETDEATFRGCNDNYNWKILSQYDVGDVILLADMVETANDGYYQVTNVTTPNDLANEYLTENVLDESIMTLPSVVEQACHTTRLTVKRINENPILTDGGFNHNDTSWTYNANDGIGQAGTFMLNDDFSLGNVGEGYPPGVWRVQFRPSGAGITWDNSYKGAIVKATVGSGGFVESINVTKTNTADDLTKVALSSPTYLRVKIPTAGDIEDAVLGNGLGIAIDEHPSAEAGYNARCWSQYDLSEWMFHGMSVVIDGCGVSYDDTVIVYNPNWDSTTSLMSWTINKAYVADVASSGTTVVEEPVFTFTGTPAILIYNPILETKGKFSTVQNITKKANSGYNGSHQMDIDLSPEYAQPAAGAADTDRGNSYFGRPINNGKVHTDKSLNMDNYNSEVAFLSTPDTCTRDKWLDDLHEYEGKWGHQHNLDTWWDPVAGEITVYGQRAFNPVNYNPYDEQLAIWNFDTEEFDYTPNPSYIPLFSNGKYIDPVGDGYLLFPSDYVWAYNAPLILPDSEMVINIPIKEYEESGSGDSRDMIASTKIQVMWKAFGDSKFITVLPSTTDEYL